nr:hypothetical protein [Pandoravirus belohorizontensis]
MGQSPLAFSSPAVQEKNKKYRKTNPRHPAAHWSGGAACTCHFLFFSFDAYANKKFAAYTAVDLSASGSGIRRTTLRFLFSRGSFRVGSAGGLEDDGKPTRQPMWPRGLAIGATTGARQFGSEPRDYTQQQRSSGQKNI